MIGSKIFTENIILGEIIALILEERYGFKVERKFNMGGTKLLFDSLKSGGIDIYPEYTGTGYAMILKKSKKLSPKKTYFFVKKKFLKKYQLVWSPPLGFENTYILAVRKKDTRFKKLSLISEVQSLSFPVNLAVDHEFTERKDGWILFSKQYQLSLIKNKPLSMNPALMYSAIHNKKVDMIMAYSTDGRIKAYQLKTLKDDKDFFPSYLASYLTRQNVLKLHPEVEETFSLMENQISQEEMMTLNNTVDQLKRGVSETAKEFLLKKNLLNLQVETHSQKAKPYFKNSQTKNSQTKNSQTKNSQTKNSQTKNSQTKNSQTKNSQTKNSQTKNSQTKNSQTKNSQALDTSSPKESFNSNNPEEAHFIPKAQANSNKLQKNEALHEKESLLSYYLKKRNYLLRIFIEHLILVFTALMFALLFSLPVSIWAVYNTKVEKVLFFLVNTLQTIPSIALLGALIPFLGIGFAPAVTALFFYSLLPLVRNIFEGIKNIDKHYIEISAGIGLTKWQILRYIQIPLALPVIIAGVRTAVVLLVGTATLAAFIGAGGLGDPIFRGIATLDSRLIFMGAIPSCALAILLDQCLGLLERLLVSKGLQKNRKIQALLIK